MAALQEKTGCEIFVGDVTNEGDVSGLAEFVRKSGGVSVVVNNAGLAIGVDPVAQAMQYKLHRGPLKPKL